MVFIIAEAGSNWRMGSLDRDIKMTKSLIDVASDAGADAVKFQTFRAETTYVPNAGASDYLSKSGNFESMSKIFDDLSMPYEMISTLYEYCKKKKIQFMSTPFSVKDAEAIDPFVQIHKIASYEITHSRLIEFVAKTGKPLILSTGASTYDDIEWALKHFYNNGGKEVTLLQTTATYPAPLTTLNLKVLSELKNKFQTPVGLSDHSLDPIIGPVIAVALGASVIEKHFTLSKHLPGPDHSFALEPKELKLMVDAIRNSEKSLGSGYKIIQKEEEELRSFAQRGIQAIKEIKRGEIFQEGLNIDILRPGKQQKGLHPRFLEEINGKRATRNIPIGQGLTKDDYE